MGQAQGEGRGRLRIAAAGGVLLLTALAGGLWLQAGPARTPPWHVRPAKLQDGKKVVEEEEDTPTPKRKVVRIGEEDDKPAKARPVVAAVNDFAKASRDANHTAIRDLYAALIAHADQIILKRTGRVTISGGRVLQGAIRVMPLPFYVGDPKDLKGNLEVFLVNEAGAKLRDESERIGVNRIEEIRFYELAAIALVKKFLEADINGLGRQEKLTTAEQILERVLRQFQSDRERGVRRGKDWDAVEEKLKDELLTVLLAQLEVLKEGKSWDAAFELTRRMSSSFTSRKELARIAKPLAELLKQALDDSNFSEGRLRESRRWLRQFEEQFPELDVVKPIQDKLREEAQGLFERGKALVKAGKKPDALIVLRQAEDLWPELPGLRAYRIQEEGSYQVLKVGMRETPKYLSPAWALSDADLRAVDLLFESLVNLAPDDQDVVYYHPALAEGRLKIIPLGRQFQMPHEARWSDGHSLTATDLRHTVGLLKKGVGTGRGAAWGDLLERVRVEGDPYKVKVMMRQGFVDPLALMSFKVLPAHSPRSATTEEFARKPITSGPFLFDQHFPGNPSYTKFLANRHYSARPGRLPLISEVHFYSTRDPVKLLKDQTIDLALDLTAEQAATLREDGNFDVPLPKPTSVNRRIYYLAVNCRNQGLNNADIRIALAQAINREQLLNEYFRGKKGKGLGLKVHKALNGPYPVGSWACNRDLAVTEEVKKLNPNSVDPWNLREARQRIKREMPKVGLNRIHLTLHFPSGDKMLADAIEALCEQVNKDLPEVQLVAKETAPHLLRDILDKTHQFDLAYTWYDFPDESFWLMPLLGLRGKGGSENPLGYTGALGDAVQAITTLRFFNQVRTSARSIHRTFLTNEMPFIPLWQLDPLHASRKGKVEPVPFEPHRIFARIEHWRVRGG